MDSVTLLATLLQAKAILSSEETWIAHEYAGDADGHWKPVGSREAVRFSLWGALMRGGASKEQLAELRSVLDRVAPDKIAKMRAGKLSFEETTFLLDGAVRAVSPVRPSDPAPAIDARPVGAADEG